VSPNPSEPAFDELLEQLKSALPEPLFATVSKKFLALQYAELKIQVLEERLRLKRIEKYGPGSEKLTNEQLELLELEPGVSTVEVQAESARERVPGRSAEKRVRQHPGRQALPAELPRVAWACEGESKGRARKMASRVGAAGLLDSSRQVVAGRLVRFPPNEPTMHGV
jgi:hypothetical protein